MLTNLYILQGIELIDKVIFEFIHLFSPHEKSIDFLDSSPA
jgi:hypothetical protein